MMAYTVLAKRKHAIEQYLDGYISRIECIKLLTRLNLTEFDADSMVTGFEIKRITEVKQ